MVSKNNRTYFLNLFLGAGVLLLIMFVANTLSAESIFQSAGGAENWRDPVNLSHSGSASEPRFVVDANDVLHVIWREDAVDSFFYTREDDGVWREPVAVELPFGTPQYAGLEPDYLYNPQLFADGNGRLHAFWLGEKNALYYSSVLADEFGNFNSWRERQLLAVSAVAFAVVVDAENNIHLSYVRDLDSAEAASGLYYRKMAGLDFVWGQPLAIYNSAYYRALDANNANIGIDVVDLPLVGEVDLTNALVVTSSVALSNTVPGESLDSTRVLAVADNRSTEQVFAFPAVDGGAIWFEPVLVDERQLEDSELSTGPSQISVKTVGDEIHVSWLAGHDANCEQYHQWSVDGGLSWQPPIMIQSTQNACPEDYRLLAGEAGLFFSLGFRAAQAYLQAWNGTIWSEPEIQSPLTRFVDPVTKRQVSLGCQQTAVTRTNDLVVVGCGAISETVNDIWLLERPLGDETTWFPPPETIVWQQPELLFDSVEETLTSPVLIHGSEGTLHAFWIGANAIDVEDAEARIYYSQWDGSSWIRVIPLLPLGIPQADQLQGVIDDNNDVILAWRNPETNIYYTKQAFEQNLRSPTDWSDSIELLEPGSYTTMPDIYVDQQGAVNVIFATPLNENRGVYWMRTEDSREPWPDPTLIFDAEKAGWDMVDQPRFIQTENGDLHLILTRYALQPEIRPESLYHMGSQDNGNTWSEPELLVEGNIDWSAIAGFNEDEVLVIWQESDGSLNRIVSQQSSDSGQTWERPFTLLTSDAGETTHTTLVPDETSNQLHLAQGISEKTGKLILNDILWQEAQWQAPEKYTLASNSQGINFTDIASARLPDGELALLLTIAPNSEQSTENSSSLFFTNRKYEVPENVIPSQPEAEALPTNETEDDMSSLPVEPSPTQVVPPTTAPPVQLDTLPPPTGASMPFVTKIIVGLAPALLIIGSVITFSLLRLRGNKKSP